jgi:hypothetical protein
MTKWFNENGDKFLIGLVAILATTAMAILGVIKGEYAVSAIAGVIGGFALGAGGKKMVIGTALIGSLAFAGCSHTAAQLKISADRLRKCGEDCAAKCLCNEAKTLCGDKIKWEEKDKVISYGMITDDYPSVGILLGYRGACTGSLISKHAVLTAGHCHGMDYFKIGRTKYPVVKTVFHPNAANEKYDLAIAIISGSPSARQMVLSEEDLVFSGIYIQIIGVGKMIERGKFWGLKRMGITEVKQDDELSYLFSGGSGVCPGDSGGPAIVNGKIVGINVARLLGDCMWGVGVGIKIRPHLGWIKSVINGE